jgi:hypothetical protein
VGTDLTGEEHRSDWCATTQSGIFEAEDTRRDRKACIKAKQVAVAGHPSDGESLKSSKIALEGLVSLVIRKWYFRGERMAAKLLNPSSFAFLFFPSYFLRISIGLA